MRGKNILAKTFQDINVLRGGGAASGRQSRRGPRCGQPEVVAAVDNGRERGDESVGLCETAVTCWAFSLFPYVYFVSSSECARIILMHLTNDSWRVSIGVSELA